MGNRRIALDMDQIRKWRDEGRTLRSIADALGVSYSTLGWRTAQAGIYFLRSPSSKATRTWKRRDCCRNGHPYAADTSRLVERSGKTYRLCLLCRKGFTKHKPICIQVRDTLEDRDRTQTILALWAQKEIEPRADKRLEIAARIQSLTTPRLVAPAVAAFPAPVGDRLQEPGFSRSAQ